MLQVGTLKNIAFINILLSNTLLAHNIFIQSYSHKVSW